MQKLKDLFAKNVVFIGGLVFLFSVAFAVPLVFALKVGGLITGEREYSEEESSDKIFPKAVNVNGGNIYTSVQDSVGLSPTNDKDFLIVIWFKPKKSMQNGDRMVLFSKFDANLRSQRGYALALSKEDDVILPEIYWRDEDGKGTWLRFSDLTLIPQEWTMLAISYREQKFLGLHSATIVENLKPEIKLLGGYEFEKPIQPKSTSPLVIGTISNGKFRGHIGALGVFAKADLSSYLNDILESAIQDPSGLPRQFSSDEVKLWTTDGKTDQSDQKNTLEFFRGKRSEEN